MASASEVVRFSLYCIVRVPRGLFAVIRKEDFEYESRTTRIERERDECELNTEHFRQE